MKWNKYNPSKITEYANILVTDGNFVESGYVSSGVMNYHVEDEEYRSPIDSITHFMYYPDPPRTDMDKLSDLYNQIESTKDNAVFLEYWDIHEEMCFLQMMIKEKVK